MSETGKLSKQINIRVRKTLHSKVIQKIAKFELLPLLHAICIGRVIGPRSV